MAAFRFEFGDLPLTTLTELIELTECLPTGDPQVDVFDAVEWSVPELQCGIGIGIFGRIRGWWVSHVLWLAM